MAMCITWLTLIFNLQDDGTILNNFQPDLTIAKSSPSQVIFFSGSQHIISVTELTRLKKKPKPIHVVSPPFEKVMVRYAWPHFS